MYEWEGASPEEVNEILRRRDPLRHRIWLFTSSPASGSARILASWFGDNAELGQFLLRMEAGRHGLGPARIASVKDRMRSSLVPLEITGPSEDNRTACNAVARPYLEIVWWGTLDALKTATQGWPVVVRRQFTGDSEGGPLDSRRTREFVTMLTEYYCPPSGKP